MQEYNKPTLEYVLLTAEENFASGSTCIVVGYCTVAATVLKNNQ